MERRKRGERGEERRGEERRGEEDGWDLAEGVVQENILTFF